MTLKINFKSLKKSATFWWIVVLVVIDLVMLYYWRIKYQPDTTPSNLALATTIVNIIVAWAIGKENKRLASLLYIAAIMVTAMTFIFLKGILSFQ